MKSLEFIDGDGVASVWLLLIRDAAGAAGLFPSAAVDDI